jgi:hypothetical protein
MSRNYLLFLDDIRSSCKRILRHISGMTKEEFLACTCNLTGTILPSAKLKRKVYDSQTASQDTL